MDKGDSVIQISTGIQYIVFDSTENEICILQFFSYATYPHKRQLPIWQSKEGFKMEY